MGNGRIVLIDEMWRDWVWAETGGEKDVRRPTLRIWIGQLAELGDRLPSEPPHDHDKRFLLFRSSHNAIRSEFCLGCKIGESWWETAVSHHR